MSRTTESTVAKIASLAVKFGALDFVVFLPLEFAINLQLLGGIWMLQIFPASCSACYTRWFRGGALFAGWAVGMTLGTALSASRHETDIRFARNRRRLHRHHRAGREYRRWQHRSR